MGRSVELLGCLERLLPQLSQTVELLLIDDGSPRDIAVDPAYGEYLNCPYIHLVRHPRNLGVSAARNTGIKWCLERDFDLVLMTDSDCAPPPDFVAAHIDLHERHKDAVAVGGAIRGMGDTIWARLDNIMTWFHCFPGTPERLLEGPYSLPTANLSIKIRMLSFGDEFFDPRLRTGEDTAFSRRVRDAGFDMVFSPRPEIGHTDRNRFGAFVRHQYEFGRHHYVLGHGDLGLAHLCFKPWYRICFACLFVFGFPGYALLGCTLNMRPWVRHDWRNVAFWPLVQLFWLVKAVAVFEAVSNPQSAFRMDQR
jgi:GT2 family glycosyltransferase